MGMYNESKNRLVKVMLPSRSHWRRVLANAHLLRQSGMSEVFIRRSMSPEEREKEAKLRQEAHERNKAANRRDWVVYKGELKKVCEMPSRQKPVNRQ
ncbi:hypothetical protein V3C99_008312 [Haemonchus contortus]